MKKIIYSIAFTLLSLSFGGTMVSCSDSHLEDINTGKTKASTINPNAQLTTGLLQTYGDFGMMDTYRSYITGFTQHFMGGWNVANYAGSVHADNDQMRLVWDEIYNVGIKNLVDAISKTGDKPNVNAALRIHRVYLIDILTDIYGDVPCTEAGMGYIKGISMPKYDKQEDIYNWMFAELDTCIDQIGTGTDNITGDVTSLKGDAAKWKRYANSLRMRYAMRISDVAPEIAQKEFEKAVQSPAGYIASADDDAYIKYIDGPFTLYDGAQALDFRVNALGEALYGQDPTSPTMICATFFNQMRDTQDPRLYRICRHYLNTKRSQVKPDEEWNVDVTDEVVTYENSSEGEGPHPCVVGTAWWHNWVSAPANEKIPTLNRLVKQYPDAGFDQSNFNARMMRPMLSIKLEKPDCPGILMTSAEVEFLLAEAKLNGWNVPGDVKTHYEAGIRASMQMLNNYYDINKITDQEIADFIAANPLSDNPKRDINTQAWILHTLNPSEAWANQRRSDYPELVDRSTLPTYPNDFTYDDADLHTPVRLMYPALEAKYNTANYHETLSRAPLNGKDDWHKRIWWDVK